MRVVNNLMQHSSFQKEGGSPEPVPGPLNTSFEEECKLASTLILICGPIFRSKTIRPPPVLSKGGHRLAGISLLWPPLPGKAKKLFFFSFVQNSVSVSIQHEFLAVHGIVCRCIIFSSQFILALLPRGERVIAFFRYPKG